MSESEPLYTPPELSKKFVRKVESLTTLLISRKIVRPQKAREQAILWIAFQRFMRALAHRVAENERKNRIR